LLSGHLSRLVLFLFLVGSYASPVESSIACPQGTRQNLVICLASPASSAPFQRDLCNEEFEGQLQACSP
jgi:hypothetical protein